MGLANSGPNSSVNGLRAYLDRAHAFLVFEQRCLVHPAVPPAHPRDEESHAADRNEERAASCDGFDGGGRKGTGVDWVLGRRLGTEFDRRGHRGESF